MRPLSDSIIKKQLRLIKQEKAFGSFIYNMFLNVVRCKRGEYLRNVLTIQDAIRYCNEVGGNTFIEYAFMWNITLQGWNYWYNITNKVKLFFCQNN